MTDYQFYLFIHPLTYIIMDYTPYFFVITILLFVIATILLNNFIIDKNSSIWSMIISIMAVMAILIICLCIFNPLGV